MSSTTISTTTLIETTRDTYRLVRERVYSGSHDLMQLVMSLRTERVTGTLSIDLNQGGVGRIRFREEQDIRYQDSSHAK